MKIIFGTTITLVCSVINLFFSTLLHFQLKYGGFSVMRITPMACINSIASDGKHRMLFLCMDGVTVLLIAAFVFCQLGRSYESVLFEVTPKIKTPVMAGQNQYGSARWLDSNKFYKVFAANEIDYKDVVIRGLTERGYEDLNFMKEGIS